MGHEAEILASRAFVHRGQRLEARALRRRSHYCVQVYDAEGTAAPHVTSEVADEFDEVDQPRVLALLLEIAEQRHRDGEGDDSAATRLLRAQLEAIREETTTRHGPHFVDLYLDLGESESPQVYPDVIEPWLEQNRTTARRLVALGEPSAQHLRRDDLVEDLWRLFALSAVVDRLRLRLTASAPSITPAELDAFLAAVGAARASAPAFHPFWHEIVEVAPDPDLEAPPRILEEVWPGYTIGALMLSRAGVRVAAGRAHLDKTIAETSTLYEAHHRERRPVSNLAQGWGHNSRWRTELRRDYVDANAYVYNVDQPQRDVVVLSEGDGRFELHLERSRVPELSPAEWTELVRHRSFVRCPKPHDDLWPYHARVIERR
jgi:hypothetical protein